MLTVGTFVLNARDLPRAVAFWSAALGYEPAGRFDEEWATLGPPGGGGPRVSIQRSDQPPPEVPHNHLDLDAEDATDQQREIDRLVALGATRVDWPLYPDGAREFEVLADPDGNRFCVVDRSLGG